MNFDCDGQSHLLSKQNYSVIKQPLLRHQRTLISAVKDCPIQPKVKLSIDQKITQNKFCADCQAQSKVKSEFQSMYYKIQNKPVNVANNNLVLCLDKKSPKGVVNCHKNDRNDKIVSSGHDKTDKRVIRSINEVLKCDTKSSPIRKKSPKSGENDG